MTAQGVWSTISHLRKRGKCCFCMQAALLLTPLVLLLAFSKTMCVYLPVLMNLRADSCSVWKDTNYRTLSNEFTWWQIACLLERDWDTMDYHCKDVRLLGNWPVCFDQPFSPVSKEQPCIVYSFGIAFDFRFDDAMAYYNCTVYSFDPSMGLQDHRRGNFVHFHNLGIANTDNQHFIPRVDGYAKSSDQWHVMSLNSIMKMLGHTPESISLLKLDVENSEWLILTDLLQKKILHQLPQVLIEWHIFTDSPAKWRFWQMYEDYMQMKHLGFQKFWMRNEGRNHWLPKLGTQAETAYVNLHYQNYRLAASTKGQNASARS